MRHPVDVFDLEMSYGIEPRFARHLLLECQKYLKSEVDIREMRENEMKRLVTSEETILKSVDMMMAQPLEQNLVETFQGIADAFLAMDR